MEKKKQKKPIGRSKTHKYPNHQKKKIPNPQDQSKYSLADVGKILAPNYARPSMNVTKPPPNAVYVYIYLGCLLLLIF